MSPKTKNLVAVTPGGDITTDMLAGWYLLYSIGELSVPLSRVRKAFKDHGLDPDRLAATGFGASDPVAPNDTPADRALNRRIDFVILAPGANQP